LPFSLSVADQGIGMSPDEQRRLFKRFSQADASSTRRFGGTGLGLAITRELITIMGGEISVASKVGEGSTFTVKLTLPLAAQQGGTGEPVRHAVREGRQVQLHVLVAEDDEINRMVIRMFLEAQGHAVVLVENGQKATEAVQADAYDLVLMDVMMPVMDGVTATKHIRELPPPTGLIPIIALTANAMAGDRDVYLAAGMNSYVSKPIDKRSLFVAIEDLLNMRAWTPSEGKAAAAPAPKAEALKQLDDFISSL
jgi:CheY-like chemotaxis protein